MPNPSDIIQAIDAATGDLIWEHRRDNPDDVYGGFLAQNNRNIAIYGNLIIDTSVDDHVFALDAVTGDVVWDTEVLDYETQPALQGAGPIIANGKAISGRSCSQRSGPEACVIVAHDAVTGDLKWEYRRELPDDAAEVLGGLVVVNRNIAIYGRTIIDTGNDGYVYALDAVTGKVAWETEIFNYETVPIRHTSGPIIGNGKVFSGRSCRPVSGPTGCAIVAHDAATGEELWRTRLVPAPGEPGDETWGGVPYEKRVHVGSWMVPSYDPELDLVYVGTSVTSPAPKFLLGGVDNKHLYHNSTLALDGDTGEIRWYYQHLNDHWDLDHPFERLLVDTAVAPDPSAVEWINPRLQPGEQRKVITGIPGKTGLVYTLDRETGEFLWATPTVGQNIISNIDGATGEVTPNAELFFTAYGQDILSCPG